MLKRGITMVVKDRISGEEKTVKKRRRKGAFSSDDELNMCLLDEHIVDMWTKNGLPLRLLGGGDLSKLLELARKTGNQFEESFMLQIALAKSKAESIKYCKEHQEQLLAAAHSRWVAGRRRASEQRVRQGGLNPMRPKQTSPVFRVSTLQVIMFGSTWLTKQELSTLDQVCSKTAVQTGAWSRAMVLRVSSAGSNPKEGSARYPKRGRV